VTTGPQHNCDTSNILYHIFYLSIHILALPHIFLPILYYIFLCSLLLLVIVLHLPPLCYILPQILLLVLSHSSNSLYFPKYFLLLYTPSIILGICLFLVSFFYLLSFLPSISLLSQLLLVIIPPSSDPLFKTCIFVPD